MKQANIYYKNQLAGLLTEDENFICCTSLLDSSRYTWLLSTL